jgi:uncharacterized Tic20 family protein|tara:strand:- start:434 stop:643 length:210 start_codon:yes stop_codon:yes gene_type:complete
MKKRKEILKNVTLVILALIMLCVNEMSYSLGLFDEFWYRYTQITFSLVSLVYIIFALIDYKNYIKTKKV